jgi:hypothetical protein
MRHFQMVGYKEDKIDGFGDHGGNDINRFLARIL